MQDFSNSWPSPHRHHGLTRKLVVNLSPPISIIRYRSQLVYNCSERSVVQCRLILTMTRELHFTHRWIIQIQDLNKRIESHEVDSLSISQHDEASCKQGTGIKGQDIETRVTTTSLCIPDQTAHLPFYQKSAVVVLNLWVRPANARLSGTIADDSFPDIVDGTRTLCFTGLIISNSGEICLMSNQFTVCWRNGSAQTSYNVNKGYSLRLWVRVPGIPTFFFASAINEGQSTISFPFLNVFCFCFQSFLWNLTLLSPGEVCCWV